MCQCACSLFGYMVEEPLVLLTELFWTGWHPAIEIQNQMSYQM